MPVGRKPKPRHLKILTGKIRAGKFVDAGNQEILPDREPAQDQNVIRLRVRKPAKLSKGASEVWDEYAPMCERIGTLTAIDKDTFAQLCEVIAKLRDKPAHVPLLIQLRQLGGLFGMGASERARIGLYLARQERATNDAAPASQAQGGKKEPRTPSEEAEARGEVRNPVPPPAPRKPIKGERRYYFN